jgi:rod shape determining protein RodA
MRPPVYKRILAVARHLDLALIAPALAVSVLGVVMVASVTKGNPLLRGGGGVSYTAKQAAFLVAGLVVMTAVVSVSYRQWAALAPAIHSVVVVSLAAVLATPAHLGAQRWFQVGPIQIQPSEMAVVSTVLCLSWWLSRERQAFGFPDLLVVAAIAGVPEALIAIQPDLGTAVVLGAAVIATLVAGGLPGRYLALVLAGVALAALAVVKLGLLHSYQLSRLTAFLHPGDRKVSAVYNLLQSEAAIGSGGLWGTGYGHGPETNLAYVPEVQTDFIFSAVGEQLGFVGSMAVLALFGVMVWRLVRAVALASDSLGRAIAGGVLGMLGFSVFENTGMTIGIMPIAGVPLPFMSYGGSAMVAFWAAVGLAVNVEARRFTLKRKDR